MGVHLNIRYIFVVADYTYAYIFTVWAGQPYTVLLP